MRKTHKKQPSAKSENGGQAAALKGMLFGTSRLIGYARVSTVEQNLDVQLNALEAAGVHPEDLYIEKLSALNAKRPMFSLMMKTIERGDILIFHALSRIGRDSGQIREILDKLAAEGVSWRSLTEPHLDTTTAVGRFMVNMTSANAQYERDQIVERTKRGMTAAKGRGMYIGRQALFGKRETAQIKKDRKHMTRDQVAAKWKCSAGTIDKYTR